jgi:hypothetical protein
MIINTLPARARTKRGKKGKSNLKVSEQKLLKTNVEKMSLLGLPQKWLKTSQLKISSKYVDDTNDT